MSRKTINPNNKQQENIIKTAWLYYHDDLTQTEIAKQLNISRATVINYLQKAREKGFIKTTLNMGAFSQYKLSKSLCDAFNLESCSIVPSTQDEVATLSRVCRVAAQWLPDLLQPDDILGVAWGETVFNITKNMTPHTIKNLKVVQLLGSLPTLQGYGSEVCSVGMADKLGAECVNLYCPAILSSTELSDQLRKEPLIANQIKAMNNCNKTIFAVGSCTPNSHVVRCGLVDSEQLEHYKNYGIAGVLCGQFIDSNGTHIPLEYNSRMIGCNLDILKKSEMSMLVSSGEERVIPMVSALKGGYVTHLVTDTITAEKILAIME